MRLEYHKKHGAISRWRADLWENTKRMIELDSDVGECGWKRRVFFPLESSACQCPEFVKCEERA